VASAVLRWYQTPAPTLHACEFERESFPPMAVLQMLAVIGVDVTSSGSARALQA